MAYDKGCSEKQQKNFEPFLDLCVSSLCRGHANLLCIVPILSESLSSSPPKIIYLLTLLRLIEAREMFHHIRKFSSAVKASPISVLYPKNNNKVVRVMDQTRFLDEESSKKPGAARTLLDHISLRPFELTDVDDIMVWTTDDQLSRYCEWEMGIYKSKEDALEDIKNNIIHHPWYRAICLKNQSIGKIFVDSYPGAYRFRAELSYGVASKHWGKGIATTAVKMVLDIIFKEWPHLERLDAVVNVENLGSQRVLEKAGFLKEGVHRKYYLLKGRTVDAAIFSFLSTDFKRLD